MLQRILSMLRSSDGRDSLLTYAAEGLAMVGMVLAYRLAAQDGRDALDQYVVVRRTVSFIYPLLLMGAVVGITRFVAMKSRPEEQRRYLVAALGWVLPLSAATVAIGLLFPEQLSWLVFGSAEQHALIPPLALMTATVSLYGLGYAFLRGQRHLVRANAVQVLVLAVSPCVSFLLLDDLVLICWATGFSWLVLALLALAPALLQPAVGSARRERGELLRYGVPRVPGDLAFGALLTIPVYVVARTHGLSASGEIGFGTTLLNLAAAVFSPLALVLLPASASQLASGDHAGLSRRIGTIMRLTLLASAGMTLLFELLADPLLHLYLGETYADYVTMSRIVFLGALPFGLFVGLRSVLDAFYHTPRNGLNLTYAFLILMAGSLVHFAVPTPVSFVAWVLVAALSYLGLATWRDVRFVDAELLRLSERKAGDIRVLVVIPAPEGSGAYPFAYKQTDAFARDHGATVTYFHLESRSSIARLWASRRRMKARLKSDRPDVVLAYYGSVSGLFTVLSSSIPVVVYFLGSDLNRTPADGRWRDLIGRMFSQAAAFFAGGIVCVSEGLRDQLWWRTSDARVIPAGVDARHFTPMPKHECRAQLGWPAEGRVILFNGNNPAVKRLDLAEQAMELVRRELPDARLEVLQGGIPHDRMPLLMNAADALLLCSDSEGSPGMVKEAMACGLPVVCNDVGDTAHRLRGVLPGAVVAQDARALADALLATLRDGRRSNGRELLAANGCDAAATNKALVDHLRSLMIHA